MRRVLPLILLVIAAFAGGLVLGWLNPGLIPWLGDKSMAKGEPPPIQHVVAQGRIIPWGGIVDIHGLPGTKVERVLVQEGDAIVAGQTELATFSGQDVLVKQVELAAARREDALLELQHQKTIADNNVRLAEESLFAARLKLRQAVEAQDFSVEQKKILHAQKRLAQLEKLAADDDTKELITQQSIEGQRLEIETAEVELARGRANLSRTQEGLELAVVTAESSVTAARETQSRADRAIEANRSAAIAQEIAAMQAANGRVIAPISGQVLKVFVQPGETVINTPILQLGNVDRLECVAEVNESLVSKVQINQRATIYSPAFSKTIEGTVRSIGKMVGLPSNRDPNPLALVDRHSVDVRIEIDEQDSALAREFINLQVTVEIRLADQTEIGLRGETPTQ